MLHYTHRHMNTKKKIKKSWHIRLTNILFYGSIIYVKKNKHKEDLINEPRRRKRNCWF